MISFPPDSNELNTLKDLLDDNKVKTKSSIRAKLWKSNKASELLALYRLIATPEEHKKLNQSYIEHNGKSEISISFED
jgi:ATP-dependent exoDNAse (exonuclease V) beta subunit